jgi:uncharacterized protein (DUF2336 family)
LKKQMPVAQATLVPDLEDALRHISVDKHAETVRRVADFFLAGATRFNDEHVRLFDRVLGRLIVAVEAKALAELARRLAPVRNAPGDVIRYLARNPDITVAAPVLARSVRLDDYDLIDIAKTQGQAHLLAISGRIALSETVTDVLVECGDRDVTRNLAMNFGAQLSKTGLITLAERATQDTILAEKLGRRPELTPRMLRTLLLTAGDKVRQGLLAAARPDTQAEIQDIVASVSPDVAEAAAQAESLQAVRALERAAKLDEAKLLDFAKSGRVREAIAALAILCDVSIEVARRFLSGDQPDAALLLCQAAGMSWPTACAVLRACNGGRAAELDHAFAGFERLTTPTAERIVDLWRACDGTPAAQAN